jgi:hypothetical protein
MAGTGIHSPLIHSPRMQAAGYAYRSGMGMMGSAEFNVLHDDFNHLVTTNVPTGWSAAIIDTGATVTSGGAGASHGNGVVSIASDAGSEGAAIYLPKQLKLTVGKKFFMEVRMQTTLAAETDVQFGLSDLTATTNPEDLWTTTAASLISFGTLAGSAVTGMLSDAANTGTAVLAGSRSLSNATWHTLAIEYNGNQLKGYVDGQLSVIPTATQLAPFIGARTGATAGNITVFDYVRIAQER